MIEHATGDILKADAEVLVNPVNCVGVMGKGLALQCRNAYPENFKEYKSIAVPPLGCGLGRLNWAEVRPRIERAFEPLPDVRVLLYAPDEAPTPAGDGSPNAHAAD